MGQCMTQFFFIEGRKLDEVFLDSLLLWFNRLSFDWPGLSHEVSLSLHLLKLTVKET